MGYKNKFNRTKIVRQLRDRKQYIKPTVANRKTKLKAVYIQAKYGLDS